MNKENIAIVGLGYVGKAVARFFKDHYNIRVYDPYLKGDEEELTYKNVQQEVEWDAINSCDLGIVCVPTPESATGEVDLSIVEETIEKLNTPVILIKSTIPPSTSRRLAERTGKKIVFSPEYIGEGRYEVQWWKDRGYPHPTDMKKHDFHIFGGQKEDTHAVIQFYKPVVGPEVRYIQTDWETAELTKYMENSWGATKVVFANEFYDIAKAFGVDYDELRELFLLDGRTERMHTAVFENKRGFGGKCFPKDVKGIVHASTQAGHEPKLLKTVLEVNKELNERNSS